MNPAAKAHLNQAMNLIESTRYRMGVSQFLTAFIDEWAFHQTGLYPCKNVIPADLEETAIALSKSLSAAMHADPVSDVLGYVLSEAGFHQKGTSFYPTPTDVSDLLQALIGGEEGNTFYEPCCGTSINAILWMEGMLQKHGPDALADSELTLEDIDPLMVKCSMLQLVHYLASRQVTPKALNVIGVDVITRRLTGVAYYAERPVTVDAVMAA